MRSFRKIIMADMLPAHGTAASEQRFIPADDEQYRRLKIVCPPLSFIAYNRAMATYLYETIPQKPGEKPRQFEFVQKMSEPALTHDPETGLPVRRVITGGSLITRGTSILSMNRPKRR